MFVVDASVWVARYLPSDENHDSSSQWLHKVFESGRQIVGPTLLLPELAGPISRSAGERVAVRALSEVSRMPTVRLVALAQTGAVLAARLAALLRLRGADAVYVALATELAMTLVTWDREQLERAANAARVRTPSTA